MKKKSSGRNIGQELITGLNEAIAHQRGEINLKNMEIELPSLPKTWSSKKITELRIKKLKVSQSILAAYLGVTASALQTWEQGTKKPSGSARRLLELLEQDPEKILSMISGEGGILKRA
jgi:putative transcriptional regulator